MAVFTPHTRDQLKKAVDLWCCRSSQSEALSKYGDISSWNVSNITDMSCLFYDLDLDIEDDISNWDVSNVTDMAYMFYNSVFYGDISRWNVSNVTTMSHMFTASEFDGDISRWNVSKVTDMNWMFGAIVDLTNGCRMSFWSLFDGDISNWDVSNVTDMSYMFYGSAFNGNLGRWDVSNVKDMKCMFKDSEYSNECRNDIGDWDVSNVTDMKEMFRGGRMVSKSCVKMWNIRADANTADMFTDCEELEDDVLELVQKPSLKKIKLPAKPKATEAEVKEVKEDELGRKTLKLKVKRKHQTKT